MEKTPSGPEGMQAADRGRVSGLFVYDKTTAGERRLKWMVDRPLPGKTAEYLSYHDRQAFTR